MGDLGVQVSVRLFVPLSVRPSVRPSVCLSVRQHLPWVSCERNSSYSFLLIFLKLCRCFLHDVRMCMWFGYNCWIIFYHFFHFVNLVIFRPQCIDSGYLVSATPHTILYQSFWNFEHVFSNMKMCIWFGYNPCIYFFYFFHFANFVIFWPQILWKCCDSGYLVSTTPHTILYWSFWNFVHGFSTVWRCAYGLDIILEIIFVTFSTLWTL